MDKCDDNLADNSEIPDFLKHLLNLCKVPELDDVGIRCARCLAVFASYKVATPFTSTEMAQLAEVFKNVSESNESNALWHEQFRNSLTEIS